LGLAKCERATGGIHCERLNARFAAESDVDCVRDDGPQCDSELSLNTCVQR
jgi:hypothetical protein